MTGISSRGGAERSFAVSDASSNERYDGTFTGTRPSWNMTSFLLRSRRVITSPGRRRIEGMFAFLPLT